MFFSLLYFEPSICPDNQFSMRKHVKYSRTSGSLIKNKNAAINDLQDKEFIICVRRR